MKDVVTVVAMLCGAVALALLFKWSFDQALQERGTEHATAVQAEEALQRRERMRGEEVSACLARGGLPVVVTDGRQIAIDVGCAEPRH